MPIAGSSWAADRFSVRVGCEHTFVFSTNEKGAIAEAAIALQLLRLGLSVMRPLTEGGRYDLVVDVDSRLLRVQCKWATLKGEIVSVPSKGCYHSPRRGYVRSTYSADEVDAIAGYCQELDRCYWLPIEKFGGQSQVYLRLNPAVNNQRGAVNMAGEYELGAVAQLGEHRLCTAGVRGSNPLSSTSNSRSIL